jgi:hypothetical protein
MRSSKDQTDYFCYPRDRMNNQPAPANTPEDNIKSILDWLGHAHELGSTENATQLYQQLLLLRETAIATPQRIRVLDLLYGQAERVVKAELLRLHETSLPISRKLRQRVKQILDVLEILTQDYFNTLAELFDPEKQSRSKTPLTSLRRTLHCIAWQIEINHLIASPTTTGLWYQLHSAFRTARKLALENTPGPHDGPSIRRIYSNILLAAIAQPASFSSAELQFIREYIETSPLMLELHASPPPGGVVTFWIDPDKDFPAHALIRRPPVAESGILYFSCDAITLLSAQHLAALAKGASASSLGIPSFAETLAGRGTLRRLGFLWGKPAKRRFPRRRQSYRARLHSGLNKLWQLLKTPESGLDSSEWMVINESPDGYSLMHLSGHTDDLRVGDIVALQTQRENTKTSPGWHACMVRWAISENPEHVEIGLQLLAVKAIAAEIVVPDEPEAGTVAALILPHTPPLRQSELLVVPTGVLKENTRGIVVLIENQNLAIREVRAASLDERTSSIEVFSVLPDDSA